VLDNEDLSLSWDETWPQNRVGKIKSEYEKSNLWIHERHNNVESELMTSQALACIEELLVKSSLFNCTKLIIARTLKCTKKWTQKENRKRNSKKEVSYRLETSTSIFAVHWFIPKLG
jgi:hypothetical protein